MMIEKTIFYIIASACFAIVFSEINPFWDWAKRFLMINKIWYRRGYNMNGVFMNNPSGTFPRRLKPFDCYQCMSVWVCLFASHFHGGFDWIHSAAFACVCCIFASIMFKQMKP